jgi:hypothetical protein
MYNDKKTNTRRRVNLGYNSTDVPCDQPEVHLAAGEGHGVTQETKPSNGCSAMRFVLHQDMRLLIQYLLLHTYSLTFIDKINVIMRKSYTKM